MLGNLKIITLPTVEPVVKADVKEWLRVESTVTTDDNLVDAMIRSARKAVERYTRRALMTQTWDFVMDDPLPTVPFELPLAPLQSVTGIYITDTSDVEAAAISTAKYLVDTDTSPNFERAGRIILKETQSWGDTSRRAYMGTRIRFVCGYGATAASGSTAGSCPEDIVLAIKRIILASYEFRGDEEPVMPIEAKKLLAPHRILRV